jgi:EAL domain-containing protein (putative c-di-GMP-specific phosphodiesterase class I)
MNARWLERLQLENDLRRAIERGEFELQYQPKVALDTHAVTGVEALIRWHHPKRGILLPRSFFSLAEDTGLSVELDRWVLRQVCTDRAYLARPDGRVLPVAVNLSVRHLQPSAGLADTLRELLRECGINEQWLELELLEGDMMPRGHNGAEMLWPLKELGVGIAVDDFGTGYSNLAYLKNLPVDTVKIDRSFIRELTTDPNDAAIVDAVILMTRSLGLKSVAEGIETEEQFAVLRERGCAEGQGHHIARPMDIDQLRTWLATHAERRSGPPLTDDG